MRTCLLFSTLVFLAACSGCRKNQAKTAPDCILVEKDFGPDGTVPITVDVVAEGLEIPWGLAWLPGGDALVTERPGRIRLLRNGALQPAPVATVKISSSGESGLLGITPHPDFASNRLFYIYVTTDEGGSTQNRVERWALSEDHTRATFDRVIFGGIPAATYHDGGRIRFGPDGMLYVGTGDAREPGNSQSMDTPSGKLLRLTPEGEVPTDNPFPGKAAFLLGVRNTQGFDWKDRDTLYFTDHGPSGDTLRRGHDEVSVVRKGDNLGWPTVYSCESAEGLVTPALTWADAAPPGGAAIYTGEAIAEWKGSLLIGTLGARHLHRVVFSPDNPGQVAQHEVYLRNAWGRLRETVMGPDGHLYVTTSNCDGRGDCTARKDVILRIRR
ncbi:PQQ-dependent sugar dehydrogenase [Archangium sp.]|uniref:PQQ-dependent sugar dehydrogenase n=1 Tax=Archangium sp. TaxID=1872627 RepID=UPI002D22B100|nr:PQQ-dependent sugar dehydrogenase [Archangium sp.]HYO57415.1 PQQ-dependent sugar dehydrogenase [Archangium sp.]